MHAQTDQGTILLNREINTIIMAIKFGAYCANGSGVAAPPPLRVN